MTKYVSSTLNTIANRFEYRRINGTNIELELEPNTRSAWTRPA